MWFSFMSFSFIFDCKANLLKRSLKALDGVLSYGFRFWRKFSKSRRPPAESAFFSQRLGRWTVLWTCWHFVFYKKMLFKITRSSFKKFLKFRQSPTKILRLPLPPILSVENSRCGLLQRLLVQFYPTLRIGGRGEGTKATLLMFFKKFETVSIYFVRDCLKKIET